MTRCGRNPLVVQAVLLVPALLLCGSAVARERPRASSATVAPTVVRSSSGPPARRSWLSSTLARRLRGLRTRAAGRGPSLIRRVQRSPGQPARVPGRLPSPIGRVARLPVKGTVVGLLLDSPLHESIETGIWVASSTALGAAESTSLASRVSPLVTGLEYLGFAGSGLLTWTGARALRQARTTNERLDAMGDLSWGVEGLLEFAPLMGGKLAALAPGAGLIGGSCQSLVGARRIISGVRSRDWCKVKLGAFDLASGGLWLAWDLLGYGSPLVVGGFLGLMAGRELYANRTEVAAFGRRVKQRLRTGAARMGQRARSWFAPPAPPAPPAPQLLQQLGRDLADRPRVEPGVVGRAARRAANTPLTD